MSDQKSVGATEGQIARELEMVRGAIAMVAAREASRVTVAGIRFGEEILPEAGAPRRIGRCRGARSVAHRRQWLRHRGREQR